METWRWKESDVGMTRLKIPDLISGVTVYWTSTRCSTKPGDSGSEAGAANVAVGPNCWHWAVWLVWPWLFSPMLCEQTCTEALLVLVEQGETP